MSSYIYATENTETWSLSSENTYKKELIYEGDFCLQDDNCKRFNARIDKSQLDAWVRTFNAMLSNGSNIPVPIGHTDDPEKTRGSVQKLSVEKNSRGLFGLFGEIKFRDAEAAKLALTTDVSIYVPTDCKDGKGVVYHRPIRHVALTDYPVIPKLDNFKALVASLEIGDKTMPLAELAKALGVEVAEGMDDKGIAESIVKIVTELREKLKGLEKPEPVEVKAAEESTAAPTIAAGFLSMAKDNRSLKIDRLITEGKITPAVADNLRQSYLTEAALTLSLQENSTSDFDTIVEAFSANEPVISFSEKSGAQLKLSDTYKGGTESPLVKDAELRAKEASQ